MVRGIESVRTSLKTGHRMVQGSNPAGGTSHWNFGNSVYPALPVSLGGDTNAVGPFYLVSTPGEVKDPTQGVNVEPPLLS